MAAQRKRFPSKVIPCLAFLLLAGAVTWHYLLAPWGFYRAVESREAALRMQVVETAKGWVGAKEADGSHRPIIDLYNSWEPLAVGYEVQYSDSWCSAFVSCVSIQCGLTDIFPTECGCQRHIGLFQALERWEEDERMLPNPGDLIFYDWEETRPVDAQGWSDHVGIVIGTKWPFVKAIEGNKDDSVSCRILFLGDPQIRGYAKPDYSSLVP